MYNRQSGRAEASGSANCILNFNVGDQIRIVSFVQSGGETVKTLANACSITITKL